MEKEKKYFWVKLRENFFESGEFRIILGKKDGDRFAFLYMRLLLISISSNGDIMLNENIPYNEELISEAFSLDIETVKEAMKLFKKLNLIQVSKNGILSITTFNKMVGSESAVAERMRKYRLKKLQCNTDVTNCTTEIEIETDTEKDLDLEKEKEQQQQKQKITREKIVVVAVSYFYFVKRELRCLTFSAIFSELTISLTRHIFLAPREIISFKFFSFIPPIAVNGISKFLIT